MVDAVVAPDVGAEVTPDTLPVPETVPVLEAPELEPPAPGLTVTVGKIVVVMTVLEMMVVGPLKMTVFPLPKMATAVEPEM